MRWAGHVACMGHEKYLQNFGWKPIGKDHSEEVGVDVRIILN